MKTIHVVACLTLLTLAARTVAPAQEGSGAQFTRYAVMAGNQVKTVFGNWGIIGQPATEGPRGAWKNPNDGYLGDVSPMIGAEVRWGSAVFHSVETCPFYPTQRPAASQDVDPSTGQFWTFEPVGGYFNANQDKAALLTNQASWPPQWPDKLNDATDPGWPNSWNGYFGKRKSATEETYFVMDDNNDLRFNYTQNNRIAGSGIAFKPDASNPNRNGLGFEVRVRAMQWSDFLAQDNIFWLYEITNTGTTTYNKAIFGMLVGTYVGVTSNEDYREYTDDFSFYDVNQNITYTGDFKAINGKPMNNPLWVGGTGLVGYAFLESPGNPYDGIDNDGDADSSSIGALAPKFTANDFDPVVLTPNMQIVLINQDFSRKLFTIPNVDSLRVWTRGMEDSMWIFPGRTIVAEGNIVTIASGTDSVQTVNPNALDGIDNNFNGIIDENYFIHYRQIKRTRTVPPVTLIDQLRPLRHADFRTGAGTSPYSMIDERRDDLIDNNQDWDINFDDVGRDGVAGTHDFGENDGKPTSGYDASGFDTGLPGEPHIDKTDVRESDQIGLTSFFYFVPSNQVRLGDKEWLWANLAPGYFDVPKSIVNNRPINGEDGDFFYGSGYFPLLPKKTERFSIALVYGGGNGGGLEADLTDLLKHKKTVQAIYDANYQFPSDPDLPTLTATPGDGQVTLSWDRRSEAFVDPVLRSKTFEGYKIYKSTDPTFSDIFTITDADGNPRAYKPLVQYDLNDGIKGVFQPSGDLLQTYNGLPFNLGNDSGLEHTYVDKAVENGRRYFYALVSYTAGNAVTGIYPKENPKSITIQPTGQILHNINVAVVTPHAPTAGYVTPPSGVKLTQLSHYGTGSVSYNVIDPAAVTGDKYQLEFLDSSIDSVDVFGNVIRYTTDPATWARKTTSYSVRDLRFFTEGVALHDTTPIVLRHKDIVPSSVSLATAAGAAVPASAYRVDYAPGNIRLLPGANQPAGTYTLTYQYYPVYRSQHIRGTPFLVDTSNGDNFDGIQLVFQNQWNVVQNDTASGWKGKHPYDYSFIPLFLSFDNRTFSGYRRPSDYRIDFFDSIVDTSLADPDLYPTSAPVNFRVYNLTDSTYIRFIFVDTDNNGVLSPGDELVFVEPTPPGPLAYSWEVPFKAKQGDPPDTVYALGTGVSLTVRNQKPFRKGDLLEFTTQVPTVSKQEAARDINRVKVVPNPYITAAQFELPLSPGITSGRGQRRIDFIHVPADAVINIFTARGDHVVTLRHEGSIDDDTVSWNLRTKENLDIAYGVYFYVLESSAGKKTGKIAIIK